MKKFEELSEKQVAYICNGCGGKGGLITPPYATMLNAQCQHHDYGYWKGTTIWDRFICDSKFSWNIIKDSFIQNKWKIHKALYYSFWGVAYYTGVRVVGWKFFYFGSEKRNPDNIDWSRLCAECDPEDIIDWNKYKKECKCTSP